MIRRRIPLIEITKFKLEIEKNELAIRVPEEAFYLEGLQLAKRGIAADIHRFFPKIADIKFVETFRSPRAAEKPKEISETKRQAKTAAKPRGK